MPELEDSHYLRHVTDLSQKRPVIVQQAIYSKSGMKLVDVGARITEGVFQKLVQHKLIAPIDECLGVEGAVSSASLKRDLEATLLGIHELGGPEATNDQREYVLNICARLPLASPLAFKLTVMRDQRPEVYQHTLRVVIVAVFLGALTRMTEHTLTKVAAAALFHEIGMLHIDPALSEIDGRVDDNRLRQRDSHPITGHLILKTFPEWNPVVAEAVLEHHERLDGSGYPRRLSEAGLGSIGQLLAVADLGEAILWKDQRTAYVRLSVALRFAEGKLNSEFASRLLNFLWNFEKKRGPVPSAEIPIFERESFEPIFTAIEAIRGVKGQLAVDSNSEPLLRLIEGRTDQLLRHLARAGIDVGHSAQCDADVPAEDVKWMLEMHYIAEEARWQLREIVYEIRRRLRDLPIDGDARAQLFAKLEEIVPTRATPASAPAP